MRVLHLHPEDTGSLCLFARRSFSYNGNRPGSNDLANDAVTIELRAFDGYIAAAGNHLATVVGEQGELLEMLAGDGGAGQYAEKFLGVHGC